MSFTNCHIHFTRKPGMTVYVSGALIRQLNLDPQETVRVAVGNKKTKAKVVRLKKNGKHLYVSNALRQAIRVPRSGTSYVTNRANEIRLGPLIGIMSSSVQSTLARPFGSKSPLIKYFVKAGSAKAYCFAFHPKDINWQNETVIGYFVNADGSWTRKITPLPDVIYNRLPSRRAEKSAYMQAVKERFIRRGVPIFNWSFFDKWDVYRMLQGDAEASRHVPESYISPTPAQIKQLLERHQTVYLKPTGGSLGIGIYRITRHKNRGYYIRYRSQGKNVLLRFSQFSGLMKLLRKLTGRRLKNYVVQQGIRLIELDNCPIDFRFHMNKNGQNEWVVGGIGAKKAGRGSVTTHVRTGGQVMPPEQALTRIYGEEKAAALLTEAKNTAIRLAEAIERNYPYRIGELGFDLGIDQNGHIWMFEANAKPGRSIFKHKALREQGRKSLSLVFEHCLYLSRFRRRKEES